MSEGKIINDPVFGFIKISGGLLMDIVNHRLMQRLRHIKQVGLASVVYPGAQHTRFQHSLGAYYLMSEAILSLQQKGIFIFDSEAEALKAAILMHDIGHGPFSHVLENTLIDGVSHEDISLMMMDIMATHNASEPGALRSSPLSQDVNFKAPETMIPIAATLSGDERLYRCSRRLRAGRSGGER